MVGMQELEEALIMQEEGRHDVIRMTSPTQRTAEVLLVTFTDFCGQTGDTAIGTYVRCAPA
ncbi:hypothetical protein J6590_015993 [Homalodisca vitripennis]|nr:hypothetical protein J6590_015993 [Homalodisca vitripennis]